MNKPRILIVDDEKELRTSLNIFLNRSMHCDILEASSGSEAIEIFQKELMDLILLDINMPGISGMDVLKKAKELSPETDIVVISGWDSRFMAQEALQEGAVDYITKPTDINIIYDKVCEILKKKDKYFSINTKLVV